MPENGIEMTFTLTYGADIQQAVQVDVEVLGAVHATPVEEISTSAVDNVIYSEVVEANDAQV